MDAPTISVVSYGHTLDSSVTSCGHPPRVSVPLIARILKKKLKMRTKKYFFTISTMLILLLRVFYIIYVKKSIHVVPLKTSHLLQSSPQIQLMLTSVKRQTICSRMTIFWISCLCIKDFVNIRLFQVMKLIQIKRRKSFQNSILIFFIQALLNRRMSRPAW